MLSSANEKPLCAHTGPTEVSNANCPIPRSVSQSTSSAVPRNVTTIVSPRRPTTNWVSVEVSSTYTTSRRPRAVNDPSITASCAAGRLVRVAVDGLVRDREEVGVHEVALRDRRIGLGRRVVPVERDALAERCRRSDDGRRPAPPVAGRRSTRCSARRVPGRRSTHRWPRPPPPPSAAGRGRDPDPVDRRRGQRPSSGEPVRGAAAPALVDQRRIRDGVRCRRRRHQRDPVLRGRARAHRWERPRAGRLRRCRPGSTVRHRRSRRCSCRRPSR